MGVAAPGYPHVRLAVALAGLTAPASVREQIEWAAQAGFRAVQLNAAAPGVRPRDLDRSARRDLAAVLRRSELSLAGVDLWIPPAHFLDPARSDRAMSAVREALGFAAEIAGLTSGRAVVSMQLPADRAAAASVTGAIAGAAQQVGAQVADHTWPPADGTSEEAPIGIGLDPATVLLAGGARTPDQALLAAGERLVAARLSDLTSSGRVPPGTGRLDLLSYLVAAATIPGAEPLVLDLQGLVNQSEVASRVVETCG